MSNASQLEEIISRVILPLEEAGEAIDPARVAIDVDKQLDPENMTPELKTYASFMHIKQHTRKMLARRHDPIEKAKRYINEAVETDDMFSGELQPYYPVKRENEGKIEPIYIPRDQLTSIDVRLIAKRMDKAGISLQRHARALEAWDMSRGVIDSAI